MGVFSKPFNPLTDLPDLSGKVIIVTGGNAGIGYATVKHLARKGARVYMAARNKTRAEEAIAKLKQEGLGPGNGEVIWLELDLTDPRNAKATAQEFMSKEERLDVLIHNAAVYELRAFRKHGTDCNSLVAKRQLTPDGVDSLFAVNAISPFVLTRELMPILNRTAAEPSSNVRIVVVSSDAHKMAPGKPRFRNLGDFNAEFTDTLFPNFYRYARSKLANILYASELQRRISAEGSPITVISLHPGLVNTFSHRLQPKGIRWLVEILFYPFFNHPDAGAYTSVFAAASADVTQNPAKFKGAYLVPVGIVQAPSEAGRSEELARELWAAIEAILTDKGI